MCELCTFSPMGGRGVLGKERGERRTRERTVLRVKEKEKEMVHSVQVSAPLEVYIIKD